MFGWFKEKPKRIIIKEEHIIEILDLADAYDRTRSWKDNYALWARINELYPEARFKNMRLSAARGELILEENR